jgi:hypothetical protein
MGLYYSIRKVSEQVQRDYFAQWQYANNIYASLNIGEGTNGKKNKAHDGIMSPTK